MSVLSLLYFVVGGLIAMGVVLVAAAFLLKMMQHNNSRQRREVEANAAIKTVGANRTFAPHG